MLLEMRDVVVEFGGLRAVQNVDLAVQHGEIRALIGPNGAGKTTLFNIINGIYTPTRGKIFFQDKNIVGLKPYKITEMGIARTFQNIKVFSGLSILENVMVAQHCRRKLTFVHTILRSARGQEEEKGIRVKAEEMLNMVGLGLRLNFPPESLPYGQQRLLEIARALATEPLLLLLDEPSAGMSEMEILELIKLITKIRDRGVTVILIEHNMRLVMKITDLITVFDFGVKIAEGSPQEIINNEAVIEAYLGREVEGAEI